MSLFTLLLLASCAFAQSFVPPFESSTSSNSCVKRSVIVYTSDSSTYFVTDIGTSSFPSTPTFCANASVSTVTFTVSGPAQTVVATQSASTVTVYQQATSALQSAGTQPSVDPILTNNSFENGTSSPFNSSTSTSSVWAEVVQAGVYEPRTGDSYLYIGFSYNYQSLVDESDAVATFQVQCASSAYVALDDISVTNNLLAASASSAQAIPTATTTVFRTETVVQSQILTQIETTTFISGSEVVLTTTVPTVIFMTATVNNPVTETRTVSTLLISTATATTAVPEYVNITVSSVSTTTRTETQQITQTLSPVTETLQITQTLPEVTQTLPQITETLPITQTLEITQYGPTITETYSSTSIPDFSTTSVDEPSSSSEPAVTLVEEPTSTVEEPSYSSVYVPPPPSGVPAVALARPTAVVGDVNGSPVSVDDVAYSVVLPVNLTMYGQSSANIRVSSNSLLGLTDLNWEYSNRPLPYQGNNYPGCLSETTTDEYGNTVNYCFGDAVAFGLWDDLFIYQGTQQGIYYEVDGAAPNRRTSFEFYISHFSDQSQYYHFLMNFYENKPNVINYQYLNVSDHGVSATVGVQSFSAQEFMQFSFNQAVICPGMQLTFNTTLGAGSYTIDDPGNCSIATTPPGSNNGEIARVGRMLKTRPEYRGDTAGYPSKGY
ncbi:unnamed protein product [Aureobasidium pullulans]|nr:unnamed protein product [Aureobasidium pullulans]